MVEQHSHAEYSLREHNHAEYVRQDDTALSYTYAAREHSHTESALRDDTETGSGYAPLDHSHPDYLLRDADYESDIPNHKHHLRWQDFSEQERWTVWWGVFIRGLIAYAVIALVVLFVVSVANS